MTNEEMLEKYLHVAAETDEELKEALTKESKSLKECWNYVVFTLTKCVCGSALYDGEEVMKLAIQYYKDDSIVMPNMTAPEKPKAEPKTDKAEISTNIVGMASKPKAETKKKKEEPKMLDLFADM